MKILLATAHPYIPEIAGGAQSSTHDLASEFVHRGHEVSVLSGLIGIGWRGLRSRLALKLGPKKYVVDAGPGYPVYRAWFAWDVAAEVAERVGAEAIVLQSGFPVRMAKALEGVSGALSIYLRNVELEDLGGDLRELEGVSYIANSSFTATRFNEMFGIHPKVVYPLIRRENYETETSRENVTFINPHPHKGLDVALSIAERCPEIPFVFVEAWTLEPDEKSYLMKHLARLPNVTLRPPTRDMKSVYGKARIVLAPSQWEEAFGRIAVEAHFSGIPLVASRCGGLPEAVGPGGILLDPKAPAELWAEAVKRLWHDHDFYEETSKAARLYSHRPEMNRADQIDALLSVFGRQDGARAPV
ncbi:glycosyltransferase [Aureimonas populi]|uniref:Glycosyltransferase n=1 Tax=Aureimonas populi TaxID=1701758 RepID=A0ABW5CRC3_9HYPH|nr:glycosyltransferase [Aureimonas populi]